MSFFSLSNCLFVYLQKYWGTPSASINNIKLYNIKTNNTMKNHPVGRYCVCLTALVSAAEMQAATENTVRKPNVIFIVADDIGYGDLSCYGEQTVNTPNVDALAASGILFTDAHATASTSTPSRYSLFTGCYNWRRNDTGIAPGDAAMIIRPDQHTIADLFREKGYTTGAIGKWHLGLGDKRGEQDWNGTITPGLKDIGFDYSCIMAATADRVPCVWIENSRIANYDPSAPVYVSYKENFPGEPTGKDNPELMTKLRPSVGHNQSIVNGIPRIGYMKGGGKALWKDENIADTISAKAVGFIQKNSNRPFFLYVGTNDIHVPRYPHPRFQGKSPMGLRGDAILQFDWTVSTIVQALKEAGIYENTLIVLTSDNGPVVDDGYQDRAVELLGKHRPWGNLRGTKYSIYEAGTRVPFIVSWPAQVKAGVSPALVSHIDLYASMATLINAQKPAGAASDSRNQLAALLGKNQKGREYIIESSGTLAVSTGEWKYIPGRNGGKKQVPAQLYHLKEDIGEKKNVADKYPEKVKELDAILQKEKNRK